MISSSSFLRLAAFIIGACAASLLFGEVVHVDNAPFPMPGIIVPEFPDRDFVLTDYGAVKGEKNTGAFAAAVVACEQAGGGRIVVPSGTWLTGAIRLGNNCCLHLEPQSRIEFSDDPADYPEVVTTWEGIECCNYSPLIFAFGATNVAITGLGTIAPRMDHWRDWFDRSPLHMAAIERLYHWGATNAPVSARRQLAFEGANLRPHLIQFNRCRNVLLDGFRIRESPFWMIHLYRSEDCVVRNLDTQAHGNNNDGIDIDMTRNVLVENCRFDQGDDGVVLKSGRNADAWRLNRPTENVIIRNVDMVSSHSLLGVGSELSGGVRNVWMTNCSAERTFSLFRIKTGPRRGGFVENVFFDHCRAVQADSVMSIQTDYCAQWGAFPDYELRRTRIANLRLSDVSCVCAEYGVKLLGDPLCEARGITIRDVCVDEIREQLSVVSNCQDVVIENLTGGVENPERRFPREFRPKDVGKLAAISDLHARACEFLARTGLNGLPCGRCNLPGSAGVAEIVERCISSSDLQSKALCNRNGDTIFLMLNGSDRFRVCTGVSRSATTLSKDCPFLVPSGMIYEPFLTNRNRAFVRACIIQLDGQVRSSHGIVPAEMSVEPFHRGGHKGL